jgi:pimeloyl-ACP methyl ester carboxylesterase
LAYFYTADGHKLYYETHGETGLPVILLHGLASSSRSWLRLIKALRTQYRVYAIDLPGHGQSDRWQTYDFERLTMLIRDWMTYCDIPAAAFIGVSLSCTLALTVAAQYPQKVAALILEGPLAGYQSKWKPGGSIDWCMFHLLPLLLEGSVLLFGHPATAHWLNTFGIKQKRNFKSLEAIQSLVDFRAVRQLLWQSSQPVYLTALPKIHTPTLLIRGCNDPMPRRFVTYLQEHLVNAVLTEVPESRHLVAMEKPKAFNQLVLNFLATIQPIPVALTEK